MRRVQQPDLIEKMALLDLSLDGIAFGQSQQEFDGTRILREDTFRRWYPGFRPQTPEQRVTKAA